MASHEVTVVRVYIREAEHILGNLIKFLHDEAKVRGVTVLRGIEGFSEDGAVHTAMLVDLSLDLPLIVEFFDDSEKVDAIIETLVNEMNLPHVVSFPAKTYTSRA